MSIGHALFFKAIINALQQRALARSSMFAG
jgi:hypothetical protein